MRESSMNEGHSVNIISHLGTCQALGPWKAGLQMCMRQPGGAQRLQGRPAFDAKIVYEKAFLCAVSCSEI